MRPLSMTDHNIQHKMDQTRSALLDLPAELRNRIYDYVFDDGLFIITPSSLYRGNQGITMVCIETRNETLAKFYEQTTFIIRIDHQLFKRALDWAETIPTAMRPLITYLSLEVYYTKVYFKMFNPQIPHKAMFNAGGPYVYLLQHLVQRYGIHRDAIAIMACNVKEERFGRASEGKVLRREWKDPKAIMKF